MDIMGISSIADLASGIISRFWPPSMSEEDKVKAELGLQESLQSFKQSIIQSQKDVLVAEIKGESWLQRNWRPILMLVIVAIVGNNYLVYPYLSLFTEKALVLELPEALWSLMKIGVGGYIVGRTGEKVAKTLKEKN